MDNHGFKIPCEYLIACKEQREQKIKIRRLKMWRPENWDTDKVQDQALEECGWDKEGTGYEERLVEVSADAILEALKKEGHYWKDRYNDPLLKVRKGWVVIIPDEEE